jgi:retron-type reverse transcriptase
LHPDSYGYRPGRSALDTVAVYRQRRWRYDWTIDLDVQKLFGSASAELIAVEADTDLPWVVLWTSEHGRPDGWTTVSASPPNSFECLEK